MLALVTLNTLFCLVQTSEALKSERVGNFHQKNSRKCLPSKVTWLYFSLNIYQDWFFKQTVSRNIV